jgi:N-succinyldiaminopimelate aminotransferase
MTGQRSQGSSKETAGMNPIFANAPTTIFETMSLLAREHDAINLGQGFPDDPGPEDVRRKAAEASIDGWNQYPPMMGLPELRQAIAAHYARFHGVELDWQTETLVTSGATEALAASILALMEPGDEAVLLQPAYDAYAPLVRRAGGVPRFVTLRPPHWRIEESALEAAFTPRTRVVVLNTPLNPTGTLFPDEDIKLLARYAARHDAIVISDEVWEHIVFDDARHRPVLAFPELRERSVKIGSSGKIFSLTGWKVGLVCAAPDILRVVARAHQYLTFTTPPNLQAAVAYALGKEDEYFTDMRAGFQAARDRLTGRLTEAGLHVLPCQATYFINIDLARSGIEMDDVTFCQRLVREARVAAIPVSAFYGEEPVTSVVRLCFSKRPDVLDEAARRIAGFLKTL